LLKRKLGELLCKIKGLEIAKNHGKYWQKDFVVALHKPGFVNKCLTLCRILLRKMNYCGNTMHLRNKVAQKQDNLFFRRKLLIKTIGQASVQGSFQRLTK
jgi:hypothetical protein